MRGPDSTELVDSIVERSNAKGRSGHFHVLADAARRQINGADNAQSDYPHCYGIADWWLR